jgi:hypothetical protein
MSLARRHRQFSLSATALAAVLMGAFALGLWAARHAQANAVSRQIARHHASNR